MCINCKSIAIFPLDFLKVLHHFPQPGIAFPQAGSSKGLQKAVTFKNSTLFSAVPTKNFPYEEIQCPYFWIIRKAHLRFCSGHRPWNFAKERELVGEFREFSRNLQKHIVCVVDEREMPVISNKKRTKVLTIALKQNKSNYLCILKPGLNSWTAA